MDFLEQIKLSLVNVMPSGDVRANGIVLEVTSMDGVFSLEMYV